MNWFSSLDAGQAALALAGGGFLLVLVLWLSWRHPTPLFLIALASLAVQPQVIAGGSGAAYEWGLHQTLLVVALVANGLRYGIRRTINWPIMALIAVFALNLTFGNLYPKLTFEFMLVSLAILALPWTFPQVVMAPGSRRLCSLVITLSPALSVVLGFLLEALGITSGISSVYNPGSRRLQGATGDGAILAVLALAGFVVAVHESTRPGRPYAAYLAVANLGILTLTGGRTALFSSILFLAIYFWLSETLRANVRAHPKKLYVGLGAIAAVVALALPMLDYRTFEAGTSHWEYKLTQDVSLKLNLSVRDKIWSLYSQEFLESPIFGRGVGAGFIAAAEWVPWPRKTPHNEYLHLLVSGGLVGFGLLMAAIVAWYRRLLRLASPNDREFLIAFAPALAVFAITEDVLIYPAALAFYAYLGIMLTPPLVPSYGLGNVTKDGQDWRGLPTAHSEGWLR